MTALSFKENIMPHIYAEHVSLYFTILQSQVILPTVQEHFL